MTPTVTSHGLKGLLILCTVLGCDAKSARQSCVHCLRRVLREIQKIAILEHVPPELKSAGFPTAFWMGITPGINSHLEREEDAILGILLIFEVG